MAARKTSLHTNMVGRVAALRNDVFRRYADGPVAYKDQLVRVVTVYTAKEDGEPIYQCEVIPYVGDHKYPEPANILRVDKHNTIIEVGANWLRLKPEA